MPALFIEYPFMILALLVMVPIEYNWLKSAGFTVAPVLYANLVATLAGIPLSFATRQLIADQIGGSSADNPFKASIYPGGEIRYDSSLLVVAIIVIFNFAFLVSIEWLMYRLFYKTKPAGLLFKETFVANTITVGVLALFFLLWALVADLS